ncbi:MAG: hypothetical protein ABI855_06135 [Bacteroidota bacterium]
MKRICTRKNINANDFLTGLNFFLASNTRQGDLFGFNGWEFLCFTLNFQLDIMNTDEPSYKPKRESVSFKKQGSR